MVLKVLKVIFPQGKSGGLIYVNSSNAFILIVGMSIAASSGSSSVAIVDSEGNPVDNLWASYTVGETLSVSGSNSFSTTASTSTGITSTSESVNESISGLSIYFFGVSRKALLPPGFGISTYGSTTVFGFIAIQADTLEQLRGFL